MIVAEGLTKRFDNFVAVDRLDLTVSAGEVLALLGPNGAGKTTTIRLLTSVLRPSTGSARVAGFDVVREARQVRASVGVLTEQHGLYGKMSALEYLLFYGQLFGLTPTVSRRRSLDLLERFGLTADQNRRLGEFSRGMRQKVALARTLIHEPPVILLDEPTSAMDPESTHLVRDTIRELRSADRAVILCTHNLAEAEELADRIAILRGGRIVAQGGLAAIKHALLGAAEFRVQFSAELPASLPVLPEGIQLIERGGDWLCFQSGAPEAANPRLMRCLVEADLLPVTVQETPRRLEEAYLRIIAAPAD